jgi:ATP-dependent helicase/nuclease subunit B
VNLAAFPPDAKFLPALANAWLSKGDDQVAGLIILPNRRSARALAGAFLQANHRRSLLLPRIISFDAIDEAGLSVAGTLDLPPAVPPMMRQAILSKLILSLHGKNGAPSRLHAAWALAAELAALLDEADTAEVDLRETLPGIVSGDLAEHWQTTLKFLEIATHNWPQILAELGLMNAAERQSALIHAQAAAWQANTQGEPIWLVTANPAPARARLARSIASMPQGCVILPGYDFHLDDESWAALDSSHPQFGLAQLLGAIGARREEVARWSAPPSMVPDGRAALLSQSLLPGAALHQWQKPSALNADGLFRLEAADEQEAATAIAMVLRDTLEKPGRSAALITPDRQLATRVTAVLKRFGIAADDSAGENLGNTPPAIFLRLIAQAAIAEFAPLPLLSLLKHPLTAAGEPPGNCRANTRKLELAALRGPRPAPGFAGIAFRLKEPRHQPERDFLARLEARLAPAAGLPVVLNPADAMRSIIKTAESLAETPDESGAARLWDGESGAALSDLLLEALPVLQTLPDIRSEDTANLLDALLANHVVRKPRNKDGHPRIAIWGLQEAGLQTVDVAILAGLSEGVWPALTEPGPWLSRPMRLAAGLPAPDEKIGVAAHDFFSLCCRCPTLILAASARRDRAPAIPARWLTRLEARLRGAGKALDQHPAASWAQQLDTPDNRVLRPKPAPRPPADARPRELSISSITALMADPYAIYAQKILKIRDFDALDEESDQSLFGEIVHSGLAAFFSVERDFNTPNATADLATSLQIAMRAQRPRAALQAWWEARLERIASWIIDAERDRRRINPPVAMALEAKATLSVEDEFRLTGRIDRIEARADGTVFIMDYKTGAPPTAKQVAAGNAPQLPLEAVMAEAGAFGPEFAGPVTELAFWKLSGRHNKGEDKPIFAGKPAELRAAIDDAAANLPRLFAKFADPLTPYLATPHPDRSTYEDIYKGISRRGEWGGEGPGDDGI